MSFTQARILLVVHLTVPNLLRIINNAHLALILISREELHNFDLQVKIVVHVRLLRTGHSNDGNAVKASNELIVQHGLGGEAGDSPFAQTADEGVLFTFNLHRLAKEGLRSELIVNQCLSLAGLALKVKREERP